MVEQGRIKNIDDYDKIMSKSDEKVDLKGLHILPGFIDAHTHLIEMGLNMDRLDLSEATSLEEAKYYLEKEAEKTEEGEWIVGIDFDESEWKTTEFPEKEELDEVSDEHPVIIKRVCGHIGVANSKALEIIDDEWENIDYETGMMKEGPILHLNELVNISKEDRKEAIERGIETAHSLGITSIHDIVDRDGWEAYKELDEEKDLGLRVRCYMYHEDIDDLEPVNESEYLKLQGVKAFADGSIGGHTAALHEEYADDPGNRGILLLSQDEIEDIIRDAESKGFQVMLHAIGDRAISTALDAYEEASTRAELRHRIEHAEVLYEENVLRIRDQNLVLSTQPNFAYKWSRPGGMNEKRLGKERLKKCNPYWDIQRSLVKMAFGSDSMPMSPLFGIHSAVNHPILEQRISAYNSVQSYTMNGAYATGDENQFGTFKENRLADFVVLSDNPLDVDDVEDIEVKMTVVGGNVVYDDRD